MVRSHEERVEEAKTVNHFMKLIRAKFKTSTALEDLAKGKFGKDYDVERSLLLEVNQLGWREGQIAGVLTFLLLRRRQISNLAARFFRKNYKLDAPPISTHPNVALRVVHFTLDLSVSVITAIAVSLYYTDQHKVLSTVANTPLVPGRSVVANDFCEDICREYHQIHSPEYWNQVESPILLSVKTFCRNCELRGAYERKLRKEQGLDDTAPISIPPPGVPVDYTLEENVYSFSETPFGFDEFGQEPTIMTDQDEGWAESFVTDQEMDNPTHGDVNPRT